MECNSLNLSNIDENLQTYIFSYLDKRDLASVSLVDRKCNSIVNPLLEQAMEKRFIQTTKPLSNLAAQPLTTSSHTVPIQPTMPATAVQYTDVQRQAAFDQIQTNSVQGAPQNFRIMLLNVQTRQPINWNIPASPNVTHSAIVAHNTTVAIRIQNPHTILSARVVTQVTDQNNQRIPILPGSRPVVNLAPAQSAVVQSFIAESTFSPLNLNFMAAPLLHDQLVAGAPQFYTRLSVHVLPDQPTAQEETDSLPCQPLVPVETDSLQNEPPALEEPQIESPELEETDSLSSDSPELEEKENFGPRISRK